MPTIWTPPYEYRDVRRNPATSATQGTDADLATGTLYGFAEASSGDLSANGNLASGALSESRFKTCFRTKPTTPVRTYTLDFSFRYYFGQTNASVSHVLNSHGSWNPRNWTLDSGSGVCEIYIRAYLYAVCLPLAQDMVLLAQDNASGWFSHSSTASPGRTAVRLTADLSPGREYEWAFALFCTAGTTAPQANCGAETSADMANSPSNRLVLDRVSIDEDVDPCEH